MRQVFRSTLAALLILLPGLAIAEDKSFDSNGVRIRYTEQGTGAPVVLVHGYMGGIESSWIDNGVIANLAKDHHVIAFDHRGHGSSAKPHVADAYGTQMSEDIVRLLDHLKINQAHIVGYSMGGIIVAKLLTMHPDRFLTATLGATPFQVRVPADDEKRAAETERGSFRGFILNTWLADQPPPTEHIIRQRSEALIAAGNDPVALAQVFRGYLDLAVSDAEMSEVRVPTQAVVGSADSFAVYAQHLKALLPSLKVTIVEGATHSGERGALRRPEFVNAVREFIKKSS